MEPQDRIRVIESWMMQVSEDGGIERYDDLHVDDIDPDWKNRNLWAEASYWTFQSAVEVRDKLKLPFTLGLGMSLRSDELEEGHGIHLTQLISQVDWTPPSLYLFKRGQEPGNDLDAAIHSGSIAADAASVEFRVLDVPDAKTGLFLRFRRNGSDEYINSAFIFG
jgi:hypothetical protein